MPEKRPTSDDLANSRTERCAPASATSPLRRSQDQQPLPGGAGAVLVVDDEETVRTLAAYLLEQLGYHVVLAADGREGVERIAAGPEVFRFVLLDMTMPILSGEDTFREIRRLQPALPIILMSGYPEQEVLDRLAGQVLAAFLQKPFTRNQLTEVARRALEPAPKEDGEPEKGNR
jgi:CheY-like chemotaxis protein